MSNKNKNRNGIVYSTNTDFQYNHQEEEDTPMPSEQHLYVRREVRNGKACVVVKEFRGKAADLKELERKLKAACGTGGTAKDGEILIQGEVLDKVRALLKQLGYRTKG
ncbi:MAG: translation initiation factor [Bacteroidetes bacterium]|nr:translation initiation factor [Bacteroidota bacterium]